MAADLKNYRFDTSTADRYARHLCLPGWGTAGQNKLQNASVLVIGLGGLGSVASIYLAMAGVGRIGLLDDDSVSLSNLQRQILYSVKNIHHPKAVVAGRRLGEINPNIHLDTYQTRLTRENALDLSQDYDLVLDGVDNYSTRSILNQVCVNVDKPYIYGAVSGFDGHVSVFWASQGPCLRCLFPNPNEIDLEPQKEHHAVLNTVPSIIGALQATEALKLILGIGELLIGQLLLYNALESSFQIVGVPKKQVCPVCG